MSICLRSSSRAMAWASTALDAEETGLRSHWLRRALARSEAASRADRQVQETLVAPLHDELTARKCPLGMLDREQLYDPFERLDHVAWLVRTYYIVKAMDLLDDVRRIFNRRGFSAMSFRAIATELGISPGHLHYHLKDQGGGARCTVRRKSSTPRKECPPTVSILRPYPKEWFSLQHEYVFFFREAARAPHRASHSASALSRNRQEADRANSERCSKASAPAGFSSPSQKAVSSGASRSWYGISAIRRLASSRSRTPRSLKPRP